MEKRTTLGEAKELIDLHNLKHVAMEDGTRHPMRRFILPIDGSLWSCWLIDDPLGGLDADYPVDLIQVREVQRTVTDYEPA